MEQKKTLWIVAAAGVFLLVVVGAALILYSPSVKRTEPVHTYYNPADGWVNAPKPPAPKAPQAPEYSEAGVAPVSPVTVEGIASGAPVKVENVTVISDNTLVYGTGSTTTIDLNTLKTNPAKASVITPAEAPAVASTIQQSTGDKSISTPDSYYAPAPVKAEAEKKAAPAKPAVKQAAKPKAEPAKPAAKASKPAAKQVKAPAKPAVPESFWIQVGSYEAKKSADDARGVLEGNKIPNEVFTYKDTKGRLFYRVRVGPYTTKSEAEYWQKRIASINEFAKTSSFVVKN